MMDHYPQPGDHVPELDGEPDLDTVACLECGKRFVPEPRPWRTPSYQETCDNCEAVQVAAIFARCAEED